MPADTRFDVQPRNTVQRTRARASAERSSSFSSAATGSSDSRHARMRRTSATAWPNAVAWKPVCAYESSSAARSTPPLKS